MSIFWGIVILSVIILFHELGHFVLAKICRVTVVEFSLGMGPRILSRQWHGTRYSWKLLPFGGSCMMLGEDGEVEETSGDQEAGQKDRAWEAGEKGEVWKAEEAGEEGETWKSGETGEKAGTGAASEAKAEGSFAEKPAWMRILIVAAGPFFNFIMAFGLAVILVGNFGYDPAYLVSVTEGSAAAEAGLQPGDLITKMNRTHIGLSREVTLYINSHQGQDVDLTYLRDGESHTVHITPRKNEEGRYVLGVGVNLYFMKGRISDVLSHSFAEMRLYLNMTVQGLRMLLGGKAKIQDMSGPVGVVNMIDDTYTENAKIGWDSVVASMLGIAIMLSANVGVMNLLPLPALDGGRLLFLFLELIRGKRINPEKEAMVHFAGFLALMLLMVVILYNDVRKLI